MIRITIFTYRGDALETVECARIARMAMPGAAIHIVDDHANPVDDETRRKLIDEGADYSQSRFNRQHNLNGKECVICMLQEMSRDTDDEDILIKIDPDTAVLNADFLRAFNDPSVMYISAGGEPPIHRAYGCCYAIRPTAAQQAISLAIKTALSPNCPEDLTIHDLVARSFGHAAVRTIKPWTPNDQTARWTAFNWHSQHSTAEGYASRFDVITTGNARPAWHPIQSRHELMRQLREAQQS